MSRRIELIHAGAWTVSQVVRLVQALVCRSCEVVDIDLETAPGKRERDGESLDLPRARIDGRVVTVEKRP